MGAVHSEEFSSRGDPIGWPESGERRRRSFNARTLHVWSASLLPHTPPPTRQAGVAAAVAMVSVAVVRAVAAIVVYVVAEGAVVVVAVVVIVIATVVVLAALSVVVVFVAVIANIIAV